MKFDEIVEKVLEGLPEEIAERMEDVAVIIEDEPSEDVLEEMGLPLNEISDLCGLHRGVSLPDRALGEHGVLPNQILIFRGPIKRLAGRNSKELNEQIHITVLHEIGHLLGLTEEELEELGYG